MRIIERTNPINQSVLYVVQDDSWNGAAAYQNSFKGSFYGKPYQDIKAFQTLQEARDFAYQYKNNLAPGERIVS